VKRAALRDVQHWVFDLDGTLTCAVHDFEGIRVALGIPSGRPILEYIAELPAEDGARLSRQLEAIERELCTQTTCAEGARELLEALAARGAKLAILTRNAYALALLTLEHVGLLQYFEQVDVLGREQAKPKPHTEGFERIAARWGVAPARCAMVGDFSYDLEVGRAVGALTVHVDPSGVFAWPHLTDVSVRSLLELLP
jgi:HAD superfamily hydrolase (TIGR01509 family)